jgi:hypothetical protein
MHENINGDAYIKIALSTSMDSVASMDNTKADTDGINNTHIAYGYLYTPIKAMATRPNKAAKGWVSKSPIPNDTLGMKARKIDIFNNGLL